MFRPFRRFPRTRLPFDACVQKRSPKRAGRRARTHVLGRFGIALLALATIPLARAADAPPSPLHTNVRPADLDPATFAAFVDGAEQPMPAKEKPESLLWTLSTKPFVYGVNFGDSKAPGPRHLRVGFKNSVAVGTLLVRGGTRPSVLKPDAAYPGKLDDDAQWTPAERIDAGKISRAQADKEDVTLWVLPAGTSTRALRFTHVAQDVDRTYAGSVGGAYLSPMRTADVAAQAAATASANSHEAGRIIDGAYSSWDSVWENAKAGAAKPVTAENAEWVMLTWPTPQTLVGVNALNAGFGSAEVQSYAGPADKHPREASEADWKTVAKAEKLESGYPLQLWPNLIAFDRPLTTRAVRLRLTSVAPESHPHLKGNTKDGRRVWLGELQALRALSDAKLETALPPAAAKQANPPIAVRFSIPEAGYVTLVIEDAAGRRVRNLIAETYFEAGENVAWWDGTDDLTRDNAAAEHGLYHIPARFVAPGSYRARGLWRKAIDLRYEFSFYNAGNPPWLTNDGTGGWLTNHTPPSSVLFVPDCPKTNGPSMLIGSFVSEGGSGLAWTDLEGKKLAGQNWVGGTWTGAPYLARDAGKNADPAVYAYAGVAWHNALRLTALTKDKEKPVFATPWKFDPSKDVEDKVIGEKVDEGMAGLAAHDGLLVVSLSKLNKLLVVDAMAGKAIGELPVPSPRGLAFDAQGRLLFLAGTELRRRTLSANLSNLPPADVLATSGLEDPQVIAIDGAGNILVSDRGQSNQVKVFDAAGKPLPAIGKAGPPVLGAYDPLHMNNPRAVAVDSSGKIWVAEEDFQPKRVSVWSADGQLLKAFYGPNQYGGGGKLDPRDGSRLYYNGIEFKLNWEKGTDQVARIFQRDRPGDLVLPLRADKPETPVYVDGRQYMHNGFNSSPTQGSSSVVIWLMREGLAVPVAAAGRANEWDVLKGDDFKSRWPTGEAIKGSQKDKAGRHASYFIWSDGNGDAKPQPDEVSIAFGSADGFNVAPDLSIVAAYVEGKVVRWTPANFSAGGAPKYDLASPAVLIDGAQRSPSSGGNQALVGTDGWTVLTTAPKPLDAHGVGGVRNGEAVWSYPSLWPGLHASHSAPVPHQPGVLIGTTRLLGDLVTPPKGDAGPMFALNGNHGNIALMTQDGLFVADLFRDMRVGKSWHMPAGPRGMLLNDLTPGDEHFFPSISQAADGKVYLIAGKEHQAIVRVDGLETIKRLPPASIDLTPAVLETARDSFAVGEAARQAERGSGVLKVALRKGAPNVDGKLDDWAGANWAEIDKRGAKAYFNSDSKPYDVSGAVAIAGDRLYAAWRTGDGNLLRNAGDAPVGLFKTGGALDLMISTDASADPKRKKPVAGDQRLLITRVRGEKEKADRTIAVLYRAVVPGTKDPVAFSSPWRTITLDAVIDVSDQVQFAATKEGEYEVSIPLSVLGLKPTLGQSLRGDIGILRGDGRQTTQRVYWTNKSTAIVADVPSEAELTPGLWGRFELVGE